MFVIFSFHKINSLNMLSQFGYCGSLFSKTILYLGTITVNKYKNSVYKEH